MSELPRAGALGRLQPVLTGNQRPYTSAGKHCFMRRDRLRHGVYCRTFVKLLVIQLRDGCDLMDMIGGRLRAQAAQ